MCGIVGVLSLNPSAWAEHSRETVIARMASTVRHRGPDDYGHWTDEAGHVALGHQRLAILDTSHLGHQPMMSHLGRYVLTYNGEIYNFRTLRSELAASGSAFRGNSDTEVLLGAIESWGLEAALARASGMFAFALWDKQKRELSLVRDRLGEKPLYYTWVSGNLVFGSELKALLTYPDATFDYSRSALSLLLRLGYIPAPYTIYQNVWKVPAGCILRISADSSSRHGEPQPYWSLRDVAFRGVTDPFAGSEEEAVEELTRLLEVSTRGRLESDVPIGAFLSGGVDSSTVVALAQAESGEPIKTFTVAMDDHRLDEAADAHAVARHLGTDHHEIRCTEREALELVPQLSTLYDEPFADPSQIPTALISRLARQHVTVCLSGDGGDEVFGGYNRYVLGGMAWRYMRRTPSAMRWLMSRMLYAVRPDAWDRIGTIAGRLPGISDSQRSYGVKAHKLARLLTATNSQEVYSRLVSHWNDPNEVVVDGSEPGSWADILSVWSSFADPIAPMLLADGLVTLPDDMLVKVDRASMAYSLETRLPLLDPAIVEFAWQLPMDMKIRGSTGKWVLRKVLDKFVPRELIDRPKSGFDPPLGDWLRGPLRDWAEELLDPRRLTEQGFLDPTKVRQRWRQHVSGARNHDYALWAVLMFQAHVESRTKV
ncbi:MAG TPA: asparagine synthase (glutamine-hydrolyzing) [Jiangellaceae bacterium]|nr:asparagine synthase (glutamine-hydrolyzing) [Jiangellaceae bacterium]